MKSNRIYHCKGTPKKIGVALGQALGVKLEQNISLYMNKRPIRPDALDMDELHRGALPWLRGLPQRFQDELEGMAEGANLPLQRVAEWIYVEQCVQDSCSGFICLLNGRAWVGRNNDTFVPEMWGYVTIREIADRISTISFGMEGDIFTPTGINQEKLWLHYNFLPVWDTPRAYKPHLPGYVFLTEALETCSTIRQVEELLDNIDRDGGMMLFAVDGKTDEFAIFECSCSSYTKRVSLENGGVGTNHYCTGEMKEQNEGSLSRYRRLEELVGALYNREDSVRIPTDLIVILADDGVEKRHNDYGTVYANVACPSSREIWYTFGGYPAASKGSWRQINWPW